MNPWPHRTLASVPPSYVAEELALEVRRAVFECEDPSSVRCDLRMVCAAGGFSVGVVTISGKGKKHEALLVPKPDGRFQILVDPLTDRPMKERTRRHRMRFRIAHEIAHSFFYDRRHIPAQRDFHGSQKEEIFCDEFASALLVPRPAVKVLPLIPSCVFKLRTTFDVSAQVAGRALARTYPDASVIGMLHGVNPSTGRDPEWRVKWSAGPRFIPENARLHSETVTLAAESGEAGLIEKLKVGEAIGRFSVEAALNRGEGQMIVILLPA